MKRALAGSALVLGVIVSGSAPAFAGEITGNGKPTPVNDYRARSICSFSGQNDDPDATEEFEGGRVQSFGDIVQEAIGVYGDGKGASALVSIITGQGPGVECPGIHRE